MKKRAVALYRVSTDKQDYEMQVRKVRGYCKDNDIDLVDEYTEMDVSGYKTRLKDRKELLKILTRSEEEQDFDYLVVYIFDRIIRREDEAPFVLSHLEEHNVECVEAASGERMRNADMTDKLMNYIRFWQAEYESVKTSQRVTDAMRTLNEQNRYAGGTPAFGYERYDTDNYTTKGKRIKELRINEDEAWIVRDIFDMYVNRQMGSLSIAEELNTNPLYKGKNRPKRRRDKENPGIVHEIPVRFRQASIVRILKNPVYIGRRRYNTVKTTRDGVEVLSPEHWKTQDHNVELQIIDDDMFLKAQKLLEQNKIVPGKTMQGVVKYGALCSGIAYCECGAKLYTSFSRYKYTKKDGSQTIHKIYRYVCRDGREYNQSHKERYGKTYYAAKKYDGLIRDAIVEYLNSIDVNKLKDEIDKSNKVGIINIKQSISALKSEKEQCYKNIANFEKRIDNDIDNVDIYIKGIRRNENRANAIGEEIDSLNDQLIQNQKDNYDYVAIYNNYKDYYNEFVDGSTDKQKLILDQMVDKVIFKNNGVEIVLKTAIEESLIVDTDDSTGDDSRGNSGFVYLQHHTGSHRVANTQRIIGVIVANFDDMKDVI